MLRRTTILFLIITLFFTACGTQEDQSQQNNQNNDVLQVEDSGITQSREHTNQEAANRLVQLATDVPEVNDASAIVFGNYTLVGIDINEELDRTRSGSVKHSVTEIIKKDPYGHYAFVFADGDVVARLDSINQNIQNGARPGVILDELANLVGRYMPDMPQRETDHEEQYDSNQQETEEIEQERDNQSNPSL